MYILDNHVFLYILYALIILIALNVILWLLGGFKHSQTVKTGYIDYTKDGRPIYCDEFGCNICDDRGVPMYRVQKIDGRWRRVD